MGFEFTEYLLLAGVVVLGVLARHWWQRRRASAARHASQEFSEQGRSH